MIYSTKHDSIILQFFLFILACTTIFCIREYLGETITGRLLWFSSLFIIFFCIKKYKLSLVSKIYIISITFGFILHVIGGVQERGTLNGTVIVRVVPILLLAVVNQQKYTLRHFTNFIWLFFLIECGISIYEKINLTHLINYSRTDDFAATSLIMVDSSVFRSFSLMLHPLFNANTVSIFLAFILCSDNIKSVYKYIYITIGLLALWGFNSRGAMIVWGIILIYRLLFYKAKLMYVFIALIVLYFAVPPLIEWIVYSGILGRLTDVDFSDSSSLTRIEAFNVFFSQEWSFEDILIGGRILCYPGTDLTLENGILLDLGYWGLVIGTIKIISEILITYQVIQKYNIRDRILIMIAIWGVAFMNNNSFQTWLLPTFVLVCIALNDYLPLEPFPSCNFSKKNNINYKNE